MKRNAILLMLALSVPAVSFAQRGQQYDQNNNMGGNAYGNYRYDNMQYETSVLSVFSENGEPFYLVLNGVKQNMTPQSKIRVELLPKYVTDVEIAFTDRTPPIRKRVSIADPVDGRAVNLTLRVSRGRQGAPKLKFHRMAECDKNYRGPRDEYVMYYGKPQQVNTVTETSYMDPITGQWVTETTTTTTTNNNGSYGNGGYGGNGGYNNGGYNNGGYNNNGGGYGNNGGYNDNNGGYGNNNNYPQTPTPPPPPLPMAMDQRTFADAKQSIAGASFDDTKLSTAKTILAANYVTTAQVTELCKLFSFENNKLSFAQFAYARTIDQQNYFKVGSAFDFDANKKALNDFISRSQK